MQQSEYKNNVTRLLDAKRVDYQVHIYSIDPVSVENTGDESGTGVAVAVAKAIGLPVERVFKTLVVLPEAPNSKPSLVLIPARDTLNLKAFARATGIKKAKMATRQQAEALTGLQAGGISPLALTNKPFRVYLDQSAHEHTTIAVSAGERGANIEISAADFMRITKAKPVALQNIS